MADPSKIEPSPNDPNLLSVVWMQWFELLRKLLTQYGASINFLTTRVGQLGADIDSINLLGVERLIVTHKAGFPTVAELRAFSMSVWYNTATSEYRLWFLEGGSRYAFVLTPLDGPL